MSLIKNRFKFIERFQKRFWREDLFRAYQERPWLVKGVIYFIFSLMVVLLIFYPREYITGKKYQAGEIADKTIKVLRDLEVEDLVSTSQYQKLAEEQAREVYDYDPSLSLSLTQRLSDFFIGMRELYQTGSSRKKEAITVPEAFKKEREEELISQLGVELSEEEISLLKKFYFDLEILSRMKEIIDQVYVQLVVIGKSDLEKAGKNGILVRNLKNGEKMVLTKYDSIKDIESAKTEIKNLVNDKFAGYSLKLKQLAKKILSDLIRPNLTFNKEETEKERELAVSQVKPVYFKFKKGEVIVRKGDRITEEQWKKIEAIQGLRSRFEGGYLFLGLLILLGLSQFLVYEFAERNIKKFRSGLKSLLFLSLTLLLSLFFLKLFRYLGITLKESLGIAEGVYFYYLAGIAGSAMLVRMILNSETSAVYIFLLGGFSGLVLDFDFYPVVYHIIGGLVSASEVKTCEQRSKIFRAGFYLGLVNLIMVLAFSFLQNNLEQGVLIYNCIFGFLGGIISAIAVTGLTPAIESLFGYTTNIKLLELLNQENPLLKELSLKAPGTHQHSLQVANLAEAAAEAIGANPLLCRVMAMYHDIGKINMPHYFAENQWEGENPHTKLKPTMSSLILVNHIKEGSELAHKHRLPEEVINGIQQHHGSSLIRFFYEKAKEGGDLAVETINEQDFRYPGPNPRSREAGILMLADIVESAARSIKEPTPAKIQGMVQTLINRAFADGQLNECEITLKDLHEIAKAFVKILGAIYHSRPEYPLPVEKGASGAKKNGAGAGQQSQGQKNSKESASTKDTEIIKRLGS